MGIKAENEVSALHWPRYPSARQVGPLIFFSGICGLDRQGAAARSLSKTGDQLPFPALGMTAPDSWEAPLIAQATIMYDELQRTLPRGGAGSDGILFYGIYVKDMRDYPTLVRVRSARFTDGISPPCTCSEVSELPCSGAVVYFDAIGFSARSDGSDKKLLVIESSLPGTGKMANYQLGTRVGPFVFLAGVVAPDAASTPFSYFAGRDETDTYRDGCDGLASLALERSVTAQTRAICRTLSSILEEQGGALRHLAKINIYLTSVRDFPVVSRVLQQEFSGGVPAMTVIEIACLAKADFLVEIEGIAYIDDTISNEIFDFRLSTSLGRNLPACLRGNLLFISGTVAFDLSLGRLVTQLTDIDETGAEILRQLLTEDGRQDDSLTVTAVQAWHILNQFIEGLQPIGGLEKIAKMTVYLKDIHNLGIVTKLIERLMNIENRPAFSVFQPTALPFPGAEIMIEGIAAR